MVFCENRDRQIQEVLYILSAAQIQGGLYILSGAQIITEPFLMKKYKFSLDFTSVHEKIIVVSCKIRFLM